MPFKPISPYPDASVTLWGRERRREPLTAQDTPRGTIVRLRRPLFVQDRKDAALEKGRMLPPGSLVGVVRNRDNTPWLVESNDGLQALVSAHDLEHVSTLEQMAFWGDGDEPGSG